ncbi:MAG TPA: RNA 2',3'-cyclic phosphodiesterase [Micropepsaceae bacterium]|jgi:2'-5' RNA ligase|nr:RNA 2',3'-cyclic phosphodiesterase [Micropepsaceae bacterium]
MIRLFVALELPETLRDRLAALEGGVPGARWATGEQFHLTLRFVGEVDENVAHDIDDALAGIRAPRFTLELAGVGEFGGKKPRALWAGVRANDALLHLQKKIETALQRIGLPAEERKFSPHVTLARMRGSPREKVVQFLTHNSLFASGPFPVDRFVLFSSHLGSGGSVYHAERTYPLT